MPACIFCDRSSEEVGVMINQNGGENGICDACVWVAVRKLLVYDMKQMVTELIATPPNRPTRLKN